MAALLFVALHLLAVFFFWPGLFVTVPAHLIYDVLVRKKASPQSEGTGSLLPCPKCARLIQSGATYCPHCGSDLPAKPVPAAGSAGYAAGQAAAKSMRSGQGNIPHL